MPDDEASYDPQNKTMLIPERTFRAMNRGEPRVRFTIAHEIAHAVLHETGIRNRNVSGRRIEKISKSIRIEEIQANKFAAAFLVPSYLVADPLQTTAECIVETFGISLHAALNRKNELEREYRIKNRVKRELPSSVLDFLITNKK